MTTYPHDSPELVFGLVAPIGCNIDAVESSLIASLRGMRYDTHLIRLSGLFEGLMKDIKSDIKNADTIDDKIAAGNKVRKLFGKKGILSLRAITEIRRIRAEKNSKLGVQPSATVPLEDVRTPRTAYIVRQLKRLEEVEFLKTVYGPLFVQVSVTQDRSARIQRLTDRTRREQPSLTNQECHRHAIELMSTDEDESSDEFGQRVSDIFHLGDVFIDASRQGEIDQTVGRFIDAFFGKNEVSPTREEFGSYMAKAASLRSADLSRQVGAAIMSPDGDLISVGCNEVPKPLGGNYWHDDPFRARDIDRATESNKDEINRIIFDFLKVLQAEEIVPKDVDWKVKIANPETKKAISRSLVGGITEYGRMVHAEMNALVDAARLGRSVRGADLYVTTFPCHNCAKHIIASGIERIIFIEPYPKSRTEALFSDALAVTTDDDKRVRMKHFAGISPRRYRDIFEKGRRRDQNDNVQEFYDDKCDPRVGPLLFDYTLTESQVLKKNAPKAPPSQPPATPSSETKSSGDTPPAASSLSTPGSPETA